MATQKDMTAAYALGGYEAVADACEAKFAWYQGWR